MDGFSLHIEPPSYKLSYLYITCHVAYVVTDISYLLLSKQSRPSSDSSYKRSLIWVTSVCKSVKRRLSEVNDDTNCIVKHQSRRRNENCQYRRLFITAPCVTALAEAFCILMGDNLRCKYRVLAFNLIFGRKIQFIVLMLRVFRAHFSAVKCY